MAQSNTSSGSKGSGPRAARGAMAAAGGTSGRGTSDLKGAQRGNLSSNSGQKQRSPTSHGHTGSRVDPSHTHEQSREIQAAKAKRASGGNRQKKG